MDHKFPLLIVFIFSGASSDSKISSSTANCLHCKILTESFSHWLDKTSRGKFEGGNAAWEEANLKSYARSEIRLVEIQEVLCSELKKYKDQCYELFYVAEQPMETWWFLENNVWDLYTWLCIDNLKLCCPKDHYGPSCVQCPLDQFNNICGGHGECDGEGTRQGNGSCLCNLGYTGFYCDKCIKNFYRDNNFCKPCHRACNECTGDGVDKCLRCNSGWQLQHGHCTDINECYDVESVCKLNEYCINQEGSYICKICDRTCKTCYGSGSEKCNQCADNHVLWKGGCIEQLKEDLLVWSIKWTVFVLGLTLVILCILYRITVHMTALVIAIMGIYIYFTGIFEVLKSFI